MSENASSVLPWSTNWSRKRKHQSVSSCKKLRSKIPRKKRFQVSPILCFNVKFAERSAFQADSSSSSCFHGEISSWISEGLNHVNKKQRSARKKKRIEDARGIEFELQRFGSEERRPITRSYWRRKQSELEAKKRGFEDLGVELSESSCVESSAGVANRVPIKSREVSEDKLKLKYEREEGIDVTAPSDAISLSEVSCIQQGNAPIVCEQSQFAEKTSKPGVVNSTEYPENEASTNTLLESHSVAIDTSSKVSYEETNRVQALSFSEISQNYEARKSLEFTVDQKPNDLDLEYSLACSEDLSYEESSDHSSTSPELSLSQFESELFPNSSDLAFSDYSPSMLFDSLNDSSQESDGESPPPAYFPFFLQYQKQLFKFNSSDSEASDPVREEFYDEFTLLKFENDEEEQTYRKFRSRERKLLLDDYREKYSSITEFGDVVLLQRHVMISWIVDQSEARELQSETMFLGVSLLDRFLSRGFFKQKRKLQVLGIACLALATRIEENQPYNGVRQSAFHVGKNVYSKSEVIGMEWLVQEVLSFQCFLPTIYNFLGFYLKAAKATAEVEKRAKYLAVLSLLDYERLCYWPSTVAAGLVILASLAVNRESSCQWVMEIHVRTKNDDLPECIQCLEWLVKYVN